MEVPTELVPFLIFVIVALAGVVVALARHIKSQNVAYGKLYEKRVEDVDGLHEKAFEVHAESMDVIVEMSKAQEKLQDSVCRLKAMVDCRVCPARARLGGSS